MSNFRKGNSNVLPLHKARMGDGLLGGGCGDLSSLHERVEIGQSVVLSDPGGISYAKYADCFKNEGYIVKVLNLSSPEKSDGWNPLREIGDEASAQLFINLFSEATGGDERDHIENIAEMFLLKALCLYVVHGSTFPDEDKNMRTVCELLMADETGLFRCFESLTVNHPAGIPFTFFKRLSEDSRSRAVVGLAGRMQVFFIPFVKKLTMHNEIELIDPGRVKCAYFIIPDEMNSSYDVIEELFISLMIANLVRYASIQPDRRLPVPVSILMGDEVEGFCDGLRCE